MTDEPKTRDELVAELKAQTKAAVDAAFAAGQEAARAEGQPDAYHFSNGQLGTPRGSAYADELKTVLNELRLKGVRRLKDHPDVLALNARHGR